MSPNTSSAQTEESSPGDGPGAPYSSSTAPPGANRYVPIERRLAATPFEAQVFCVCAFVTALAAHLGRTYEEVEQLIVGTPRRAYVVGSGGSSPLGCLGYAVCAEEILSQEVEAGIRFSRIIVPNGSSGTHAGLAAGLAAAGDQASRVQSFSVLAPNEQTIETTKKLAADTLALIDPAGAIGASEILVSGDQLGDGYGVPTDAMFEAVRLMARMEGLLLDPVYGGKTFAGMLTAIRKGDWPKDEPLLFIMTGGTPGLFAYEPAFRAVV